MLMCSSTLLHTLCAAASSSERNWCDWHEIFTVERPTRSAQQAALLESHVLPMPRPTVPQRNMIAFGVLQAAAVCFLLLAAGTSSQSTTTVPWYEDLPAVAMDYKVHVDPGKEDCYFQYVNAGATFFVSFQVLRGGDGMAGFAVRHPSGQIVHPYQWKANGEYQDQKSLGGYYSICIDNQFSRFADKLVNLYITVVRYDKWEQYTKEVEEINMNIQNFTGSLMTVERNINDMQQTQHHYRSRESRDYHQLMTKDSYVLWWSFAQISVIVIASFVQVYFVRKLFDTKSSGYSRARI